MLRASHQAPTAGLLSRMAHAPQRLAAESLPLPATMDADVVATDDIAVLRIRGVPARDVTRWLMAIAWMFTLLLHVWLLFALREGMRPRPLDGRDGAPIQVELIPVPMPPPAVEPLVVEPLPRNTTAPTIHPAMPTIAHRNVSKPESATMPSDIPTPAVATDTLAMRFYNPDSSANIPKDLLAQVERSMPKPNFTAKEFVLPEFMQHKNPLHYLATDFEPTWVPINENLLDEFVRRNLTREVTFKTPWGGTIRCTWVFVMGACAGVPPAAWKNPDKKTLPMPAPEWQ